jgi:predicted DNA-binding protein (MmcQ/YjbR family)
MVNKQITDYCLAKPGAYADFPFGEIPVCYKVCGRLFLQLYPVPDNNKITISCEPMPADFYRQLYPGVVMPGYHFPVVSNHI